MALFATIYGVFNVAAFIAWLIRQGTIIRLRSLGRRLFSLGSDQSGRWLPAGQLACCWADTAIASLTPAHSQISEFVESSW